MKTKTIEDPGAVVFGNFINYYQFNRAEERFTLLPKEIWLSENERKADDPYLVLDVGCNTGDLTQELWKHIAVNVQDRPVYILGVDLDETLILRANESNQNAAHIKYLSVNVMDRAVFENVVQQFLNAHKREKFDTICCFSITMWIHLNHHDAGLQEMLQRLSALTDLLLIEPQPWKCYQTAQRRLRRVGNEFPLFLQLQWRTDVEQKIDDYMQHQLQLKRIHKTEKTRWQRRLYFYRS